MTYEIPEPTSPDDALVARPRLGAGVAALLLAAGAAGGVGLERLIAGPATNVASPTVIGGVPRSGASGSSSGSGPVDVAAIANKVDDGVVDITTSNNYQGEQAAGTGVVLTSDGKVLTNNHVIAGATSISVTDVGNGRTYSASVVGYDRAHDIAVLQLKGASGLKTVSRGDSGKLQVGATVVGLGNAGGRGGTPSYAGGTVTALNQPVDAADSAQGTVEHLTGLIETNASIVPGESGGPLADTSGKVVGIITAGSASFRFAGTSSDGYAIPINTAMTVVRQIDSGRSSGTVHVGPTAFLGVEVQGASNGFGATDGGATIADVVPNGPAASAGLSGGDTIVTVDGHAVATPTSLANVMILESPGRDVPVEYVDSSGSHHTVTVHLASGPPQ